METQEGAPDGWAEWEDWQDSEECSRVLRMIGEDLQRLGVDMRVGTPGGVWLGMSINTLASSAFAAGVEAGRRQGAARTGEEG